MAVVHGRELTGFLMARLLIVLFILLASRPQPTSEAEAIYQLCMMGGGECLYEENSRVTTYLPEKGGANCDSDCSITAYSEPVDYERGIACGPSIPYGTPVYIQGFGWRGECKDLGGGITDNRLDVAMRLEDEGNWIHGDFQVVWVLDQ